MADWKNRMDMIINKIKHQLNAKGVDSINQLVDIFHVSCAFNRELAALLNAYNLNFRASTQTETVFLKSLNSRSSWSAWVSS